MKQLTLFDIAPEIIPKKTAFTPTAEHKPGDYLEDFGETNGAVICHIMRPAYIGKLVCYDCSTQSHKWTRVGILEKYFECRGVMRSVIYVGTKDRILLDHYPGREIYEVEATGYGKTESGSGYDTEGEAHSRNEKTGDRHQINKERDP